MSELVLHNYFRSSSSTRLRAALNLKGLEYSYVPHHLRKGGQRAADYLAINPQGLVPALILADGEILTQSLAIIEFLEEVRPEPALLPAGFTDRARVRALALSIACEIHPVNNLRVLEYLREPLGIATEQRNEWFRHWVDMTFVPFEKMLATDSRTGRFCHGDTPSMADVCLFAQVINNRRFAVDMTRYPTISRIFEACLTLSAFAAALPDRQPDAE